MQKIGYPPGFYVYRLIDPRTCLPFYVGKGSKGRAWQHQASVERTADVGIKRRGRKNEVIRQILLTGADVEVEIVACYSSEVDALDHEYRLVDADPALCNVVPGGGAAPHIVERRRAARAKEREAVLERERKVALAAYRARRDRHFLGRKECEPHADAIVGWLQEVDAKHEEALIERDAPYTPSPKVRPPGKGAPKSALRRARKRAQKLRAQGLPHPKSKHIDPAKFRV